MIVYFDASALAKLFVSEAGEREVLTTWNACDLAISSPLTFVEVTAMLAASRRRGRIDDDELARAARSLDRTWEVVVPVPLDRDVTTRGAQLTADHALKGAEAVHLASALVVGAREVTMAVWDRRLHAAARAEGLGVLPATLD